MTKWHVIRSDDDLPRAGKCVLVTRILGGKRRTDIDILQSKSYVTGKRDPHFHWDATFLSRVIAWAELPEPYRGEKK